MKLVFLFVVCFLQNIIFAGVSRSRNSGDVKWHLYWAFASNGWWFLNQVIVFALVIKPLFDGEWSQIVVAGLVYTVSTALGSAAGMWLMLNFWEKNRRQVGSR